VLEVLSDSLRDAFYAMRHELHVAGVGFEHEGFYTFPPSPVVAPPRWRCTGWRPIPFAELRALGRSALCAKLCICRYLRLSSTLRTGMPWRCSLPRSGRAKWRTSTCVGWLLVQVRVASSTAQLLQPLGSSRRRWRESLRVGTGRRNDALRTCEACLWFETPKRHSFRTHV
jgi:hypothetical protein